MYTQQFIKSVKKIFLWYLYRRFREQILKKSTILDKNIEIFIKLGKFGSILRHSLTG